jgi:hypothetical protein
MGDGTCLRSEKQNLIRKRFWVKAFECLDVWAEFKIGRRKAFHKTTKRPSGYRCLTLSPSGINADCSNYRSFGIVKNFLSEITNIPE